MKPVNALLAFSLILSFHCPFSFPTNTHTHTHTHTRAHAHTYTLFPLCYAHTLSSPARTHTQISLPHPSSLSHFLLLLPPLFNTLTRTPPPLAYTHLPLPTLTYTSPNPLSHTHTHTHIHTHTHLHTFSLLPLDLLRVPPCCRCCRCCRYMQ